MTVTKGGGFQWGLGCTLSNFMNVLHLMGFGAKLLSGRKAADPEIARALCEDGETLVGWIVIGTPRTRQFIARRPSASISCGKSMPRSLRCFSTVAASPDCMATETTR